MEEPLSSRLPSFDPQLAQSGSPSQWRIRTTFIEAKDIIRRFGLWPDDVLTAETLQKIHSGNLGRLSDPFVLRLGDEAKPSFPFLDENEESAIGNAWGTLKDSVAPILREGHKRAWPDSSQGLYPDDDLIGPVLLVFQTLMMLSLRATERSLGIWKSRTSGQEMGGLYALRPANAAQSCQVQGLPLTQDGLLCLPWGGPYREYSYLLPLVENQHTQQVLASADACLEVVPEGHVLKMMVKAGLLRELRQSFMDSHWTLSIPVVEWGQVRPMLPALSWIADAIAEAARSVMPQINALGASGRYSHLDGTGDYTEMAYSVLFGSIVELGVQSGLIPSPAKLKTSRNGVALERPRGKPVDPRNSLPGVCILRGANAAWSDIHRLSDDITDD